MEDITVMNVDLIYSIQAPKLERFAPDDIGIQNWIRETGRSAELPESGVNVSKRGENTVLLSHPPLSSL